eukprot:m.137202 g.137202  ORF g.137202 m.137202 type:complete len:884 (-) comp16046_c0_seq1:1871-4522(-)
MPPKPRRTRTKEKSADGLTSSRITVAVRARPLLPGEIAKDWKSVVKCIGGKVVVLTDPSANSDDVLRKNRAHDRRFAFDHVMDGDTPQREVYTRVARPLLKSFVAGYNCTIFAYGPTSAGKTYSMLGTPDNPGMMFLTMVDLFKLVDRRSNDYNFEVTLQYVELYNESLYDLLVDHSEELDLRDDATGQATIVGGTKKQITSAREVMQLLTQGNHRRTQEATAANATSSRSHAILHLELVSSPKAKDGVPNASQVFRRSSFFMCDLAGSERAAQTQNTGIRMVEGQHINRSLLALGNCINALSAPGGRDRYTNFRDSKLTRLLKDALSGNCRTAMIAHVSPASFHFEESYNTLNYAKRAKTIKMAMYKNVQKVDTQLEQYTEMIATLKGRVTELSRQLDEKQQHAVHPPANDTDLIIRLQRDLDQCLSEALELYEQLYRLERETIQVAVDARDRVLTLVASREDTQMAKGMTLLEQDFEQLDADDSDLLEEASPAALEAQVAQEVAISKEQLAAVAQSKRTVQSQVDQLYQKAQGHLSAALQTTDQEGTRMILKNLHELHRSRLREASANMVQQRTAQTLSDLQAQVDLLQKANHKQTALIAEQSTMLDPSNVPKSIKKALRTLQTDHQSLAALQHVTKALPLPAISESKQLVRNGTYVKPRRKPSAKAAVHVGTDKLKRQAVRSASRRQHRSGHPSTVFNQSHSHLDLGETFTKEELSNAVHVHSESKPKAVGNADDDDLSVGDLSEIGSDDSRLASALAECRDEEAAFQRRQAEIAQQQLLASDEESSDGVEAFPQEPHRSPGERAAQVAHVRIDTGVHHSIRCESTDNKQRRAKAGRRRVEPGHRHRGVTGKPVAKHVPQLDLLSITASPYARPVKNRRR